MKIDKKDGFKKASHDKNIEDELSEHCSKYKISKLDCVRLFPVLSRRQSLKRFLAHHELFLKTLDVPGDIIELGVYRGLGLLSWANFLETYSIGDRTKRVFGFDNWSGFKEFDKKDGKEIKNAGKVVGGFSPKEFKEELENAIKIFDKDRFVPWKKRLEIIDGDIEKTIPAFVKSNPGLRFSLIHFDVDLYKPTKIALEQLWPKLSKGGILIFDEYGIGDWQGETQAVDEFIKTLDDKDIKLKTLCWGNVPAAYIIK